MDIQTENVITALFIIKVCVVGLIIWIWHYKFQILDLTHSTVLQESWTPVVLRALTALEDVTLQSSC